MGWQRLVPAALIWLSVTSQAQAAYMCVGASPRFLLFISDRSAQFDFYPGTSFTVTPPAPEPPDQLASTHALTGDARTISVILNQKSCPVLGATLPVTVDLALPDGDEAELISGCCALMAQ